MDLKLYDSTMTEINPSWWSVTQVGLNSIRFDVTTPPQTAEGAYTVEARVWDVYNVVDTPSLATVPFNIARNYSPKEILANPIPNPVGDIIPLPFSFSFTATDHLLDGEGDDIEISTTFDGPGAPDTAWLSLDYTGGIVTVSGTPPGDNAYAVTYSITFHVEDRFDDPPNDYVRSFTYT